MKTPKIKVEFFYDIISPYSWIAFELLCRYREKWDIDLKFMPFLLGKVMKETGNQAPAVIVQKGLYMNTDLARLNEHYKVPVKIPQNFFELLGKGTLSVQRFVTSVDMKTPQHTEELSRKFWTRLYDTHEDIHEVESMKVVGKEAGLNDNELEDALNRLNQQETKDRLKYCTNKALEYGAFGAPIIVAHINNKPEMFFGSDRMELMGIMMGKTWAGPQPAGKL